MKDEPGTKTELIRECSLLKQRIKKLELELSRRERTLKTLQESEEHFRAIANYTTDLEHWFGPDGRLIWINPAVSNFTGYSADECMRMIDFPFPLIHPDDRERMARVFSGAVMGINGNDVEFRIRLKDGTIKWASASWQSMHGKDGRPIGHRSSIRDITERKKAEEKLRYIDLIHSKELEVAIDGILVVSEKGEVLSFNQRFVDIWGIPQEVIETKEDEQFLQAVTDKLANPEDFLRKVKYLYKHKKETSRDEVLFSDGRVLDRYSAPLIDDEKRYHGRVWYFRDITERKKMEEELRIHRDRLGELVAERTIKLQEEINRRRQREEQFLAIAGSIKEWIWEMDTNFIHTYLSPRIYDILGYKPEELIGKSPVEIMPPEEVKRAGPLIKKIISQRKPFLSFENVCFHKNGKLVFIEANGRPFFDEKGKLLGYRGSCHDITGQKKTMDALKEREHKLISQSRTLKEVNTALRVLLKQRKEDREELENKLVSNIREMILPYVLKLRKDNLNLKHRAYLDIIATNLNEIISPFISKVMHLNFTPKEIEVSSLIKEGRSTKEIAELMGVAPSAVDSHRNNIRAKLGLNNKKINLRTYLLSLK